MPGAVAGVVSAFTATAFTWDDARQALLIPEEAGHRFRDEVGH
jgi:hypothetical protein